MLVTLSVLISNPVTVARLAARGPVRGRQSHRISRADLAAKARPDVGIVGLVGLIAATDALLYLSGRALVTPFQLLSYTTAAAEGWLAPMCSPPSSWRRPAKSSCSAVFCSAAWARSEHAAWPAIVVISLLWTLLHLQYDWTGMSANFRHRPVSRLGALAQRLDAAHVHPSRAVQPRRHDRDMLQVNFFLSASASRRCG